LICAGEKGHLIGVNQAGKIVWEYQNPFKQRVRNGRVMTSVFNAKKYREDMVSIIDKR
jgi:hypothetical protein